MKLVKNLFRKLALSLVSLTLISQNSIAQTFDVDTIKHHGDVDHCINFVYIAEGYTSTEQAKFISSVATMNNGFFDRAPFSNYKNFFNVFAIKVISQESGVKHPRTASDCPTAAQFPTANPNNYFGTSFDNGGIHRLVYPSNVNGVNTVAMNNFPMYDQLLVLVNSQQYGGAGGAFAVGTENSYSLEVMLHEVGHSFAGLADEYWAGDIYAAEKVNMTNQSYANPTSVKWKNWLNVDSVGIYQHCCGGNAASWYKPHKNCLMEFLEREFCPVCRQRIVERIYEIANPILSYTPTNTGNVSVGNSVDFELKELLLPIPNTLKTEWKLNGNTIDQNVDKVTLNTSMLQSGNNTLEAVVTDTTYMLRSAPSFTANVNKVVWTITADPTGINWNSDLIHSTIKLYPNPAKDFIRLEASGLPENNPEILLSITDQLGRTVWTANKNAYAGSLKEQIDLSQLAAGNYVFQLQTNKFSKEIKFVVSK